MMTRPPASLRDRAGAAGMALLVVAALGYAMVAGLGVTLPVRPAAMLEVFAVAPPPPPPPVEPPPPPHLRQAAREGAAAPPNLKSKATDLVAPRPVVPPIQPPPIVTAPLPAIGLDASSGAAPVAGPGIGAGGLGSGTGSGRSGDGSGDGGTPAHVVSRPLRYGDLPDAIRARLGNEGRWDVEARYTVTAQGRVVDCRIVRSSGLPALDVATCAAMMAKLRYRPERDAAGRAVAIVTEGYQTWESHAGYAPDDD